MLLAILAFFIYLVQFEDVLPNKDIAAWHILLIMTLATIFGSAFVIRQNIAPDP